MYFLGNRQLSLSQNPFYLSLEKQAVFRNQTIFGKAKYLRKINNIYPLKTFYGIDA